MYEEKKKPFSKALFESPTAAYRGTPFWAWNCELSEEELLWQIDRLAEMGFGGFHMHVRSGMATRYLSDEFMHLIKACVEKAKKDGLLAYLYDEDRWPSGSAGGFVTVDKRLRERFIRLSPAPRQVLPFEEAYETGGEYAIARYEVALNDDGSLKSYRRLAEEEEATENTWYASSGVPYGGGWMNDQAYVDTLSKEAIARFIEVTHEAYKKAVGEHFGKTVPSIFTDEPHFALKKVLPFSTDKSDVILPWSVDFDKTFQEAYGFDILDALPELVWDLPHRTPSHARWRYYDHCCERFAEAFSDQIGAWCEKNKLPLTGHMLAEQTLESQARGNGEVMRGLRSFGIPGIDMLCDLREYTTAKQAQSVKNQYGREAMTSELYGVTNWDADFRTYKTAGDWQAALGVTQRVIHLSWVSMKGCAKRDYPASFNYQAPWYKKYPYLEDHFARVNTVLTRGKPHVRVGVIHPIESAHLAYGPNDSSLSELRQMDETFSNVTQWLLFGQIDFDYISESLLPTQYRLSETGLAVGEMTYDAVVLPDLRTVRDTTLSVLSDFISRGGKVIVAGGTPLYVNAKASDEAVKVLKRAEHITLSREALLQSLADKRDIALRFATGEPADRYLYTMRTDGEERYLFIANGKKYGKYRRNNTEYDSFQRQAFFDAVESDELIIRIRGTYRPTLLDTMTGEIRPIGFSVKNGWTTIRRTVYFYDSLLLRLSPCGENDAYTEEAPPALSPVSSIDFRGAVSYERLEDNVYLMDMARYAMEDEALSECEEEMLRIDTAVRRKLSWARADGCGTQPWVYPENETPKQVKLQFTVFSEIAVSGFLCYEEMTHLLVNGKETAIAPEGYFVDKSIHKTRISLKEGENILTITAPIGRRISLENYFLTGDFDVYVENGKKIIRAKSGTLGFGSVEHQGMAFYGGSLIYRMPFGAPCDGEATLRASHYRADILSVRVDGAEVGDIAFMPYEVRFPVTKGAHTLEIVCYGNRFNTFGQLHDPEKEIWAGPDSWYTKGARFTYDYHTRPFGLLSSPVMTFFKKLDEEA